MLHVTNFHYEAEYLIENSIMITSGPTCVTRCHDFHRSNLTRPSTSPWCRRRISLDSVFFPWCRAKSLLREANISSSSLQWAFIGPDQCSAILTGRPTLPLRLFVLHACAVATFSYLDTYVNFVKYTGSSTTNISTQISAAFFGCRSCDFCGETAETSEPTLAIFNQLILRGDIVIADKHILEVGLLEDSGGNHI